MKTTLFLIRLLHSPYSLVRGLSRAFFIVFVLLTATTAKAKAEYIFTLIADSAGAFMEFRAAPSISAAGTAAFNAILDNGAQGIFTGNGGIVTTIALHTGIGGFDRPTINAAGTVAFLATQGNFMDDRIVAGNGGPLITIADTAGQFKGFAAGYTASINSAGAVAFWASQDAGPAGIFINIGGTITPVFLNSLSLSTGFSFSMNDAGNVAFRASQPGGTTGIATVNGGAVTTIVDSLGPLNYFGSAPSINVIGTVAFVAGVAGNNGGTSGIYSGNGGPLMTIADLSGQFSAFNAFDSNQPSINGSGTVAFLAGLDVGGFGLYTGDGTDTREVIGSGDPLFGSVIANLGISPTSLNGSGQVAFWYQLADGTTGIAIANPVPEPSTALLLALSLGLSLARRTTRKC